MTSKRYRLPPLQVLSAFESAARLLSFKNAADELDVTPSAVSQHIKSLEQYMNIALFDRRHRGVELTAAGRNLYAALEHGLTHISSAIDEIRTSDENRAVTIFASTAMSSLWLTPRLTQFWKSHGEVAVNQHVADSVSENFKDCDLQIWYGKSADTESGAQLLFTDRLVPVCSPGYAKSLKDRSLETLASQTLIHMDSSSNWTNWQSWFSAHGYEGKLADGPHVNNYTIAVQSAREDVGILLGWERLLAPLLERKLLVTLDEHAIDAPDHFYLSHSQDKPLRQNAVLLKNWLLASV